MILNGDGEEELSVRAKQNTGHTGEGAPELVPGCFSLNRQFQKAPVIFTMINTVLLVQSCLILMNDPSWKPFLDKFMGDMRELSELQPALQQGCSPEHDATSSSGPAAWEEQGKEAGDQPIAPKGRTAGSSRGRAWKQEQRELISQFFSHNEECAHVCVCSHLLTCTYRWIYTHPPAKSQLTKSQLSTERLLLEKLPKE